LPLPRDERWLGLRGRSAKLHQNNGCRDGSNRRRRVHYDAKLAVVGVYSARVKVRGLGK
jgi:hypothetical protein